MSTNEQFVPNEDDLAMVQRPSTITILYIYDPCNEGSSLSFALFNIFPFDTRERGGTDLRAEKN